MSYTIHSARCILCDDCVAVCPNEAIQYKDDGYAIDPDLCDGCKDEVAPHCVIACPVNSPAPLKARKGRCRVGPRPLTSIDLFLDGKTNTFASAMVVWELCNILSQREALSWKEDETGSYVYQRSVDRGQGQLNFQITSAFGEDTSLPLGADQAKEILSKIDIRAACLHLIFAAHAIALEQPWQEEFVISDQQIEHYLGLEKRKDLSKTEKLALIKDLVQQPCQFLVNIQWPRQGKVNSFELEGDRLWRLLKVDHHFQTDDEGCKHLTGLTFHIQPGAWSEYFLNKSGYYQGNSFYQYSLLSQSVLTEVMHLWQQHEGAVRMLLWLLFKTRWGSRQPITIRTLLRIAYGEERVAQANHQAVLHKRLLNTFEGDLEALNNHGLKPIFDPVMYPPEIQPLWVKLADLPDDAEEALEFWTNDGSNAHRLTDAAPRGKWKRLLNARLLGFDLPTDWERPNTPATPQKAGRSRSHANHKRRTIEGPPLQATEIVKARQKLQLSQRELAQRLGKSQSWIRDIEGDRFRPSIKDQALLREVLQL